MIDAHSIQGLIEAAAERRGTSTAVVFEGTRIDYRELNGRANRIARRLRRMGVTRDVRVGLCLERSIDLIAGLFGILKSGGAYVPLDPAYPRRRLAFLVEDARAEVLLTDEAHAAALPSHGSRLLRLDTDAALLRDEPDDNPVDHTAPGDLAYVIYTSGSTGVPKGALIEHRGVVSLARAQLPLFDVRPDSRVLQFASVSFDASVSEMTMAFAAGAELHLGRAGSLAPGPELLGFLREHAITHAVLPPSSLSAMQPAPLPDLRVLVSAGEPCSASLVSAWGARRRFFNAYGPTESTVYTTVAECDPKDARPPIGRAIPGRTLRILDEAGREVARGAEGELYIGGVGLARGYLDRPELTAERFVRDPFAAAGSDARLYRTGDLVRARPDGNLEFLGRLDHQVKVRGFRVEPGEVEAALSRHPSVGEALVTGREDRPGERRLVAYVVPRRAHEAIAPELRAFLVERLPDYMVPTTFVALPRLPRLPNGKVDREALPTPGRERPPSLGRRVAPATGMEAALASIWEEVLGLSPLGAGDDFFELGGDSLLATRIVSRARDRLGVELPVHALLEARTVAKLAARATSADAPNTRWIPIRPRDRPLPLSFAQERLWLLHQLDPASAAYHVPALIRIDGPLDAAAIGRALDALVLRHEPLRTRFQAADGSPAQVIVPRMHEGLATDDLSPCDPVEREARLRSIALEEARRPFDLESGAPWRARLLRLSPSEHVLVLVLHHLVCDGWSLEVLLADLASFYAPALEGGAPRPPPPPLQHADFAAWQRERLDGEAMVGELAFWKRELDGAPVRLRLPVDRPRPDVPSFAGAQRPLSLPPSTVAALRALGLREGATLFATLVAAFSAWLSRLTGERDLPLGTPVAGRDRLELERLVGLFAGTLVLRVRLDGDPDFRELIRRARDTATAAYAHAAAPFEKVVEALRPTREGARQVLFQVMFALQSPPPEIALPGGLRFRLSDLDQGAAPFELLWQAWEAKDGGLAGSVVYDADLFDAETVDAMIRGFVSVAAELASRPDRPLSGMPSLDGGGEIAGAQAARMEAALRAHPDVHEALVRVRRNDRAVAEAVAWVAWDPSLPPEARRLAPPRWRLPEPVLVSLPSLPRDAEGRFDEAALSRLPVIDDDLARRWLAALAGDAADREVATRVEEAPPSGAPARLHLATLLPSRTVAPEAIEAAAMETRGWTALAPGASPPLAYADGGPLHIPDGEPRTLSAALLRTAARHPEKGITFVEGETPTRRTYAALLDGALRVLGGLRAHGLRTGDRVVLQVESLADHFTAFWGCVLGGIVPATVAVAPSYEQPGAVVDKLRGTVRLLGGPRLIASAQLLPSLEALARQTPGMRFDALPFEALPAHPPATETHAALPDEVLFHQLTSGSTGVPKCIRETHDGVVRHIHGSTQASGYAEDDVTLNWLPVDHVVPILTFHLKDTYLGCEQVHVDTARVLANPLLWLDLLEAFRVTHTWAPNFGFKLVSDALAASARGEPRRRDLSSVKRFMNAGEQVTLQVVREFLERLAPSGVRPEAMQPSFGMAEACTCMTYQDRFSVERGAHRVRKASLAGSLVRGDDGHDSVDFVDLGPPMPGVEIRIVDGKNRVVREGVIGRFQIRGGVITPGYVDNDAANREAFVGDGWFDSGDLGFLLGGRLALTGREKEMIVVRGAKFYCHEIEDVVNAVPGVASTFAAACAVEDEAAGTEALAIFFVPRDESTEDGDGVVGAGSVRIAREIRRRVAAHLGVSPRHVVPLPRAAFPKTTSGKIQRTRLKRALSTGAFDEILRAVDLVEENERTLPAWFHRRVWVRDEEVARGADAGGACLLLADEGALARRMRARLVAEGRRAITVERGERFERVSGDRFRVAPDRAADHLRVLATLRAEDPALRVERIVHAWGWDAAAPVEPEAIARAAFDGARELLALLQALAGEEPAPRALRLLLVSRRAQPVRSGEAAHLHAAHLPALLRTVPQELPFIDTRHVDLDEGADVEAVAELVGRELDATGREREVAYRDGRRLVARLERVRPGPSRVPVLARGGLFLVAGGLGAVGRELVRHLLVEQRAHVVIVGRSRLDETAGGETELEARRAELLRLDGEAARAGATLRYERADVCDAARISTIVSAAEARAGRPLDAIFHLAGGFSGRPLVGETPEELAAILSPKVAGTLSLARVIEGRPGATLLLFSSVNGELGGYGAGAYSAAARFQEQLARARGDALGGRIRCLSWSFWEREGDERDADSRSLSLARGYLPIAPRAGLDSLEVALAQPDPHLLVGLDDESRFIARWRTDPPAPSRRLVAYVERGGPRRVALAEVRDRFGTPVPCETRVVDVLPRTASGDGDGAASTGVHPGHRSHAHRAPRSRHEQTVAAIWRDLLGTDRFGVDDNFFDLGGHSMLLAQLRGRLSSAFGRDVPMVELFRRPTVAAFAGWLGEAPDAAKSPDRESAIQTRAQRQREAERATRERARARGRREEP